MNIDRLVEKYYDSLNENDIYIWQYIYHNKEKCKKISINDLATACNVSTANIVRFSQKLGLDGYSELKVYIKQSLENIPEFEPKSMQNVTNDLHKTVNKFEAMDMSKIIHKVYEAGRIFVYVTGEVQNLTAHELKRKFIYVNKHVHIVEDKEEIAVILQIINETDMFFFISFEGDNVGAINFVKELRSRGIFVVGIAKDTNNLLRKHVDEFIGFTVNKFYTGITDMPFNCTSHLYIITDLLLVKYLEYINSM